jgi:hypothetical protein
MAIRAPGRSRRLVAIFVAALVVVFLGFAAIQVIRRAGRPPEELSLTEAADLAVSHGWVVDGAPAFVPEPSEVLVANLSRREARDYFDALRVPAVLPSGGLADYLDRTLIVVAHGTVTNGLDARAAPRGDGLVLVLGADGVSRYVAIGSPWDKAIPPGARAIPTDSQPSLNDVSQARARIELAGNDPVELPSPPGDLALKKIVINAEKLPIDPSGTWFDGRSVTLIYTDGTGRFRLWLTQAAAGDDPRVLGHPFLQTGADRRVTRYAWHAGAWEIDGFAWRYRGRSMFLTAEQGEDLTIVTITKTVYTLVDPPAT